MEQKPDSKMTGDNQQIKNSAVLAHILKNEVPGSRLREGDVVEVVFIRRAPRAAYFDLGRFGTGMVFGVEFLNAKDAVKGLQPGDKLAAKIVDLDGEGGYTELSLAEAGKQRLWQKVQELQEAGEIVNMKITGANAGGLLGALEDLRAFLPISQLSSDRYSSLGEVSDRQKVIEELKKLVGETVSVKIINVNSRNNKLIVSERETMSANVKELLGQYQVGQTVDGIVSGLADFGIFVRFADNPQIEGLVHISEIDYRIIDSPKEVVKLNEAIKVKIIDIREGRVFLSLKALKEDPWEKSIGQYSPAQEVRGKVYKFNPFGATIDLDGGLQGMIHISGFGGLDEMKKQLELGKSYEFIIDTIKSEEKRITLKAKK
ncbi:MAG: S1 RNA-binding domain-containing protein [Candidatus Liptonbacteria bacterium]